MLDLDILPARIRQLSSIPADFARLLKPLDVLGMLALELLGMCYLADVKLCPKLNPIVVILWDVHKITQIFLSI